MDFCNVDTYLCHNTYSWDFPWYQLQQSMHYKLLFWLQVHVGIICWRFEKPSRQILLYSSLPYLKHDASSKLEYCRWIFRWKFYILLNSQLKYIYATVSAINIECLAMEVIQLIDLIWIQLSLTSYYI